MLRRVDRRGHRDDDRRPRPRSAVRARRSRPDRTGGDEPRRQRARRDAAGRTPRRSKPRDALLDEAAAPISPDAHAGRLRDACRCPTPASACRRRSARASSSRTSRPRKSARAPASACRPPTASSVRATATSRCRAKSGLGTTFRIYLPRAEAPAARPPLTAAVEMMPRRAPSTSCWSKTIRRSAG